MIEAELVVSAIDRIVLISWLVKDFGWMTTNIYLGWPFGLTAILYHVILLLFDPRINFRWYNISMLLWVTGNWIWMSIEFLAISSSSNIHWGPEVPLTELSAEFQKQLNDVKLVLFGVGLLVQILFYVGIGLGRVEMPRFLEEDSGVNMELQKLLGPRFWFGWGGRGANRNRRHSLEPDSRSSVMSQENTENVGLVVQPIEISSAFIEYSYIILWIMKDFFWSCGSGDVETSNTSYAIFLETMGLFCGFLALCSYSFTAYLYRRQTVAFLDSLTTIFWIAANFVWMTGEFFVRYRNLQLDDADEGDDRKTRIISATCFLTGLAIQVVVIMRLSYRGLYGRRRNKLMIPRIELFRFKKRPSLVVSSYAPQKNEDDEEVVVLF